ncbi:MAG: hypothetical protein M1826_004691 [Phylliscum demangeonii]|nr:MAG: hypothetical protein M1826_004691 [Phylliscum demangeonii]
MPPPPPVNVIGALASTTTTTTTTTATRTPAATRADDRDRPPPPPSSSSTTALTATAIARPTATTTTTATAIARPTATTTTTATAIARPTATTTTTATARPAPAAHIHPRDFQLSQLRRRFPSLAETQHARGTSLALRLPPSDPDFAFDIDALECVLEVPLAYRSEPDIIPWLRVTNANIPRGCRSNVERGFARLVASMPPDATLLQRLNALDRNLEAYLAQEEEEEEEGTAVTLVLPNRPKPPASVAPAAPAVRGPVPPPEPEETVLDSAEQRAAAAARRAAECAQLEARLGRQPGFIKSGDGDGMAYTIPVEPRRREALPLLLQDMSRIRVVVPRLYPLRPCRVQLLDVFRDVAEPVEAAWQRAAAVAHSERSLMAHVNYLVQNLHVLAAEAVAEAVAGDEDETMAHDDEQSYRTSEASKESKGKDRPPEWVVVGREDLEDSDRSTSFSELDSDDDDVDEAHEDGEGASAVSTSAATGTATATVERGTSLSFPHLALDGIELLDIISLALVVRCERCKQSVDIANIKPGRESTGARAESCAKCASVLSVAYRPEPIHAYSTRAGFLDLVGCQAVEMLPRRVAPSWASLRTPRPLIPAPQRIPADVRPLLDHLSTARPRLRGAPSHGDHGAAGGRTGDGRLTGKRVVGAAFAMPEVKFLIVSTTGSGGPSHLPLRPKKVQLLFASVSM